MPRIDSHYQKTEGFPGGSAGKESACNTGDPGLIVPWGLGFPTALALSGVFFPGESQGWGSLVGCRLWGRTESDTTEET